MRYHEPVLLKESVDGLNIRPNGIYVDATYGGGGHSREILKHLTTGKLIAIDQDEETRECHIDDRRFVFVHGNFRYLKNYLRYFQIEKVDGILADLGVSWHHFDEAERGFSFRFNGPLDMRMNRQARLTARYIINHYSESLLAEIFFHYGELKESRLIASRITEARNKKEITTTGELVQVLEGLIPPSQQHKFLARVFQALRIEVNKEIINLQALLTQSGEVICQQGRLAIISYHSIEDRMVKNYMRYGNFEGIAQKDIYGHLQAPFKPVGNKAIEPSPEEIAHNPRARSARLRIAKKN